MITYKVNVTGLSELAAEVENEAIIRAGERTDRALSVVVKAIQRMLEKQGSGRWYKSKSHSGGLHQASAPGEPPSPDVYTLWNSFSHHVSIVGKRVIGSIISSEWEHGGRRLELGGYGGGTYIAPRPYIRPAMEQTDNSVQRILDGV